MEYRRPEWRIVPSSEAAHAASMTTNRTILVTGASGHLGRRVLELLLAAPGTRTIIATTRKPEALADFAARGVDVRTADFAAAETLPAAFAGAGRALLISTDAVGGRLPQQRAAIAALERAGVHHVVYTSAPHAPSLGLVLDDHQGTEAALAATGLGHTNLRNNIYADMLLHWLKPAVAGGTLVNAWGTGAVSFISRDDCARAAVAALLDGFDGRRTIDIAGIAALTASEIASVVFELTGRRIEHVNVSPREVVDGLVSHGMPDHVAKVLVAFDIAISRGELVGTSRGFEQLTGATPGSVQAFLAAHRHALA
jgi:NAD(P)H dehydrogenase (quinone)